MNNKTTDNKIAAPAKRKMSNLDKSLLASMATAAAGVATATTVPASWAADAFGSFYTTVDGWASGPLGVGLAVTSVLVGAGHAIGKNAPMSALTGVALGALIHWGPTIILVLITGGTVLA